MNFVFLTKSQLYGKKKMEVFKKSGAKAAITDFAILTGGYVSSNYYVPGKNELEDRTGYYWTQTKEDEMNVNIVNEDGDYHLADLNFFPCGCRVALNLEDEWENFFETNSLNLNIKEVEYGYYPQKAVTKEFQQELDSAFANDKIIPLKNTYTSSFGQYSAYEYKNKKITRVQVVPVFGHDEVLLSNGEIYQNNDYVWIEILPIKWHVFEKEKILLSEKIICAGLEFSKEEYRGNFDDTSIYTFINNILFKEALVNDFIPIEKVKQDTNVKNLNGILEDVIDKLFSTEFEDKDVFNTNWNNSLLLNLDNKEFAFSLLEEEQVSKLANIKKGISAVVTPFAILEGATGVQKGEEIYGSYWTKTIEYDFQDLRIFASPVPGAKAAMSFVKETEQLSIADIASHNIGGRPILIFEDFCNFLRNSKLKINDDETINLGYFPQDFVSVELQQELENNYQEMELSLTDRNYNYIRNGNLNYLENIDEYEYKNKRYVRLDNVSCTNELVTEKTFESPYSKRQAIWIEVKPVKWTILTDRMLLCDKIIFTANFENDYFSTIEKSQICQWMNEDLREMLFQKSFSLEEMKENDNKRKKERLKNIIMKTLDNPEMIEIFAGLTEELTPNNSKQDSFSKVKKIVH